MDRPSRERWRAAQQTFEGQRVLLTMEEEAKAPRPSMRGYYFGVVVAALMEHVGEDDKREAHKMLKATAGVGSTTKMTESEFHEYVDGRVRWMASWLGCYVPDSNEVEPTGDPLALL